MNDDTIAALQAGALSLTAEAALMEPRSIVLANQYREQAALIRALIERERAGGERAQIVAWLRKEAIMSTDSVRRRMNKALDQIASGAHVGGGHAE